MDLCREHSSTALARLGERICVEWLLSQGYEILHTNYRCRLGEVDIIAKKGGSIAFVEVKTRSGPHLGAPEEAVTPAKQLRIRRTARHYLSTEATRNHCRSAQPRFDVAAVIVDVKRRQALVRWIKNAF